MSIAFLLLLISVRTALAEDGFRRVRPRNGDDLAPIQGFSTGYKDGFARGYASGYKEGADLRPQAAAAAAAAAGGGRGSGSSAGNA